MTSVVDKAAAVGGKVDAGQAAADAKLAQNAKLGCFLNITAKWGCEASDGPLRGPLLILSFILVIASVVTQKFAFIGMFDGSEKDYPWLKGKVPSSTLFTLLVRSNYTGGDFVDPFGMLNSSIPEHEALAVDLASLSNPRSLPLVETQQNLVRLCMYPRADSLCTGGCFASGGANNVDLSGKEICMGIDDAADRFGGFYDSCYESVTGMYLTLWLGLLFGGLGAIDTFTRWNKFNADGSPNDRGHIKCIGSFIFILTLCIDALGFYNFENNCIGPARDLAGVQDVDVGLGYWFLWIQFILAHTGDLVKLLIPAIDVRELEQYGGAKTDKLGRVVKKADLQSSTTSGEVEVEVSRA